MKKTLLSMLFVAFTGVFALAQNNWADFETTDLGGLSNFGGGSFEKVANPNTTGNASATVGKISTGWADWAGVSSANLGGTVDFTNGREFKMKVLSDTAGVVLLKLELQSNAGGVNHEIKVDYTTPGAWQELTFTATGEAADLTYDGFAIFCDFGDADEGEIWYIDDLAGADFAPGANINIDVTVVDREDKTTSVEFELSSAVGTKHALTNNGTGKWTATVSDVPGNTYKNKYTYTIYVDGAAVADKTDIDLGIGAGTGTGIINYAFGVFTPTLYIDNETLKRQWGGWGSSSASVVPNPSVDGTNGSSHVLEVISGDDNWAGIYANPIGGKFDMEISTEFTALVYCDEIGEILLKLEEGANAGNNVEVRASYTTAGQWQELTWDMSAGAVQGDATAPRDKFVILVDPETNQFGRKWYLDDVKGPTFIAGAAVDVTFLVEDLDDEATSVEIEVSNDAGVKIPLAMQGDTVWAVTKTLAGDNYKDELFYTLYVDGELNIDFNNKALAVPAGSEPSTIEMKIGGGLTTKAEATYFDEVFPIIDGILDDAAWDSAQTYPLLRSFSGESFTDEADLNGYFKIGWDVDGIYVLVVVNDDYYYTETGEGTVGQDWEKDKIEMYLDMNVGNLKDGGSPSASDNNGANGHYQIAPGNFLDWNGAPDWFDNTCERAFMTSVEGTTDTAVTAQAYQAISEFFLSWTALTDKDGSVVTPDNEITLGFDLTLSDNDGDDQNPRNRLVWVSTQVQAWENMDGSGTLTFEGGPDISDNIASQTMNRFNIYPNPAKDVIYVDNANEVSSVTLRNILGAEMLKIQNDMSEQIAIQTSELNSGIYLVTINGKNGVLSTQKVVIK